MIQGSISEEIRRLSNKKIDLLYLSLFQFKKNSALVLFIWNLQEPYRLWTVAEIKKPAEDFTDYWIISFL